MNEVRGRRLPVYAGTEWYSPSRPSSSDCTLPRRHRFHLQSRVLPCLLAIGLAGGFWSCDYSRRVPSSVPAELYNSLTDPEFSRAAALRDSGKLRESEAAFDRLAASARKTGNTGKETRVLLAKGGVQLREFAYREAAQTYYKVLDLARTIPDERSMGAAYVNLAEIHIQLNDLSAAEQEANSAIKTLSPGKYTGVLIRAELQLGSIKAGTGHDEEAKRAYEKAIELSAAINDTQNEALAWLILGQALTKTNDLGKAENAYLNAYRICLLNRDSRIGTVRAKLAELEWLKGNPAEGLRRLDAVLGASSLTQLGIAQHQILFGKAQMLAAVGREDQALRAYRDAVAAATDWRRQALPGEVANAGSVESIHAIYAAASDFMAQLANRRNDSALAEEALETIATNRASDLREQKTLAWLREGRLPPRYYQLLTELRNAEANIILANTQNAEVEGQARQTRTDLGLLETRLAMESGNSSQEEEKFSPQKRLVDIQRALDQNDALLSFSLGSQRSWMWAITSHSLDLEELPRGASLEALARGWAQDIRFNKSSCRSGEEFASELLSKLPDSAARKRNWLIVSDGTLFAGVPLAALPDIWQGHGVERQEQAMSGQALCSGVPLVQNHTLRYLSSEYGLSTSHLPTWPQLSFAGIGDPAYNLADPRLVGTAGQQKFPRDTQSSLARLVGSGTEVRQASLAFPQSTVLTGTEASPEGLQKILDSRPAVIHFAVHVISPPERPEDAALAMTIGRNRVPELVTPELITTYRVPGSLVVMSGCDSQQGKAVPGVGVRGLSRAWLLSGASSVVTSTWPMPDDNGRFFRTFYQKFEAEYDGSVVIPQLAAQALAETQNQMRGASGFRHDASFWAAYTVISKE